MRWCGVSPPHSLTPKLQSQFCNPNNPETVSVKTFGPGQCRVVRYIALSLSIYIYTYIYIYVVGATSGYCRQIRSQEVLTVRSRQSTARFRFGTILTWRALSMTSVLLSLSLPLQPVALFRHMRRHALTGTSI